MLVQEIQENIKKQLPFVVYRKPNQQEVFYIKEEKGSRRFVFSSFDQKQQLQITYKKAKTVDRSDLFCNVKLELPKSVFSNDNVTQTWYEKKIQEIINYIKIGKAEKIVFSRSILLEKKVDLLKTFHQLILSYQNALCYLWYHPVSGVWIGATPEVLTKIEGLKLETMSLAGTKTSGAEWTLKEKKEQQVVSDYIKTQLKEISKNVEATAAQTVQSGFIQHLQTKITALLKTNDYHQVIQKIHPTPAVCGIPMEKAQAFISKNEAYDRLFYTGFLGTFEKDFVELYVNLRCAQLNALQVKLYVGGGINEMSDSQKEWEETALKAQTVKKCLVLF